MKRRILLAFAAVLGAVSLSAGAPIVAAEVDTPAVEAVAGVEVAEAAVIYYYVCFADDGWPFAGGQSSNPKSAADACYRALAYKEANIYGVQCASYGYAYSHMQSGVYVITRADGNFWQSVFCPANDSHVGTGTFYTP